MEEYVGANVKKSRSCFNRAVDSDYFLILMKKGQDRVFVIRLKALAFNFSPRFPQYISEYSKVFLTQVKIKDID